MIDGTVVVKIAAEGGEAVSVVETDGEVVATTEEEEDIGEVATKDEVEDTGEAEDKGEEGEAEEEEGVMQGAVPLLTS